ncbi:oxidoreductase [Auriculariales sp. MPI-PUGE-AT-0066]|nr:oxidoreductase [Auriculariales sp. MPI-PUGE-AT-0066]
MSLSCEEYADRGYIVYASSRRLASMEGFTHKGIRRVELDVTDDNACTDAVQRIIDAEGRIDGPVSLYSRCEGAVCDIPLEQAKAVMDTNFFGTLRLAREIVPYMAKQQSGLLVTISSTVGEVTTPFNSIYCASKSALQTLAEALAMECSPFGIQVMNVNPAGVKSNIADNQAKTFRMPNNSLWKPYTDNIVARIHLSQNGRPMPAAEFARLVVDRATRPRWFFGLLGGPPLHYRVGTGAWLIGILVALPRWLALKLVWRFMGRLKTPRAATAKHV